MSRLLLLQHSNNTFAAEITAHCVYSFLVTAFFSVISLGEFFLQQRIDTQTIPTIHHHLPVEALSDIGLPP